MLSTASFFRPPMHRLLLLTVAAASAASPQMFLTGAPQIVELSPLEAASPAQYAKFAAGAKGNATIVTIAKLPPNLSPNYRLGVNFVYDHKNHGWILDRDTEGYILYLDRRGDGDLSAAEPLRFHPAGDVLQLDVAVHDSEAEWTDRFEIASRPPDRAKRENPSFG